MSDDLRAKAETRRVVCLNSETLLAILDRLDANQSVIDLMRSLSINPEIPAGMRSLMKSALDDD